MSFDYTNPHKRVKRSKPFCSHRLDDCDCMSESEYTDGLDSPDELTFSDEEDNEDSGDNFSNSDEILLRNESWPEDHAQDLASFEEFRYDNEGRIYADGHAIRLLRLISGTGPICVSLFKAYIKKRDNRLNGMPYDALSYAWGSNEKTESILLNDKRYKITRNLYSALQYLRHPNEDRILWVDAICIDQNYVAERNHQVGHMASIYRDAERVLFWLGESTYETDILMASLIRLQMSASNDPTIARSGTHNVRLKMLWFNEHHSFNEYPQLFRGLTSLLSRPWFKRSWILQEVCHAETGVVVCGTKSVSAHIFALAPYLLGLNPEPHCTAVLGMMPGATRSTRAFLSGREIRNFYSLIRRFHNSESSDSRDQVYALLSMASDDNMPGFPEVDYDKNIKTVLGDVFAYLFPKSWEQCGKSHNFQNLSEFVEQFSILREVEVKAIGNDVASEIKLSDDNGFVQLDIQEALRKAIQNRNTRLIRNLLYFRNLDLNKLDEKYEVNIPGITYPRVPLSPLCAAAASGYIDAVELLIRDDRVDVNIECSDRGPALSWAIESQHVNIVKALTNDPRVELHPRTRVSYRLPLLQAIELGNEVIVQILLDCGSSPYPDDALVLATGTRRLDIVKLFLESHRITKVSEKSMSNALSRAIKEEIKETVALLVRVPGISINGRGQIALWEAAKLDKPSIVQLLLDMDGIDVDASHSEDCTPLQIAVKMGHEDIVKILPEVDMNVEQEISSSFPVAGHVANAHLSGILRISVNCRDLYGRTALALAAYKGSDSVIQLLLRRREININCEDKMNDTPLMIAIRAGNHSTVQILLQRRDINANHKNNSSHTPLHIAILRGHIAMVNQLVEVGADPMEKTKSGYTALHVAAEKGDMAIVNRLIELGVDPMEKSKHGLTAFHDAVQHGSIAMVNRLAKLGIDLMTKSNTGRTALHMAVENGDMAIVNRLIELGVDPMAKSNTGLTALHEAVQHGSMAIVNRLIELGVDPMAKSYTGWTALHLAAERGDIKMVNGLVELGVDPTAKSNTGWTALHLAAQNNDIEMVNRLVELGVDPMAKSNNGRTALHEAAEIRNKEIMDRLSGLGVDPWRS